MMNPLLGNSEAAELKEPGSGFLEVRSIRGQSAITSAWARSPLRILTPQPRGPSVWAYLSSLGGGLVAGDETRLTLRLGPATRCFLTTQSSTKVYPNPPARPCGQTVDASLGSGAHLVLAPDPIQAFAGASYTQSHRFDLQSDSGLVLVDWLCSGRLARGERWAFRRFASRVQVQVNAERMVFDSLLLDPADGKLDGAHRLGRFNCLALLLILGQPLSNAASHVLDQIMNSRIASGARLECSASPLSGGVLVRLAGEQVESVAQQIRQWLKFVPDILGDDPWARKW